MLDRWKVCAIALVMVLVACGSDGEEAADAQVEETQDAADDVALSQGRAIGEPPLFGETEFLADAPILVAPFEVVEEGAHRVISVGTQLSFTATEVLAVQPNFFGHFVVADFSNRGPDDSDIVFLRTSELSDPTQPWLPREEQVSWPANDLAGWVENLADGVIATDPVETTLGGFEAVYVELELADDTECGYQQGVCVGFAENHDLDIKGLNPGALYRVWAVDQGEEDPILVSVAVLSEADIEWFDRADTILATLAFGDVEANPVRRLPAGESELDALGGVELSLPTEQTVFQAWNGRPHWRAEFDSNETFLDLAAEVRSLEGDLFANTDGFVTSLVQAGLEVSEAESTIVGGLEARSFDYTASAQREIFFKFSELDLQSSGFGWEPGSAGRLWVIEHPERGLQVISAKTFGAVDSTLPEVLMIAEEIIASIEYVDLG